MTRNLADVQNVAQHYLPCNPFSKSHHLNCGHKIDTLSVEPCAINCLHTKHGTPFVCRACMTREVIIGLGIADENTVQRFDTTDLGIAEIIVDEEMEYAVKKLHYQCREGKVPRVHGLVEFLNDHPEARQLVRSGWTEAPMLEDIELLFAGFGVKEHLDVKDIADVLGALAIDHENGVAGAANAVTRMGLGG